MSTTAATIPEVVAEPALSAEMTPPPESRAFQKAAVRGSIWAVAGFGTSQILRFGSNFVLTRLFPPDAFALMGLMLTILSGVALFCDLGAAAAVVQNPRGDDKRFLNTIWTIQVGRGLLIWLVVAALAGPLARYYRHPELATYLPIYAGFIFLVGLNATSLYSLNRHLAVGTITLLTLAGQVASIAVSITWALIHPSIWALVAGQIVPCALVMIVSHRLPSLPAVPGGPPVKFLRNRFDWDSAAARTLFHFGKWIFLSTVFFFFQSQIDRPILAKIDPTWSVLGVYTVAQQLVRMPGDVVLQLAAMTLLPALARARGQAGGDAGVPGSAPADFGRTLRRARAVILPAGVAATLALLLGAPLFFQILYKPAYRGAGWMTQWMVMGSWFAILQSSADRALLAAGNSRGLALSNLANFLVTAAGAVLGARLGGIEGFIIGIGLGNLAGHLVIQGLLLRRGVSIVGQDVAATAALAGLATVGLCLPHYVGAWGGIDIPLGLVPAGGAALSAKAALVALGPIALVLITAGLWAARRVMRGIR